MSFKTAGTALIPAALALLAPCASAAPAAAAPPAPSEALCTAHYDDLSRQLARRVATAATDASRAPLQAELVNVLRKGSAFVGHAYLESMPESEAKAKLESAKLELAQLARAERERIAPQCDSMAGKLRKEAAAWQRLIVDRFADRRAKRLVKAETELLQQQQTQGSTKASGSTP